MASSDVIITKATSFEFIPYADIQVFFLEATLGALSKEISKLQGMFYDHGIVSVDGFHTGIGFVCKDISFSLGLEIKGGMKDAFFPTMNTSNHTLSWSNADNEIWLRSLDPNYWVESSYICTITRDQFMKLKDSIYTDYMPHNPQYCLFKVLNNVSTPSPAPTTSYIEGSIMNPYVMSSDCDDFAYYIINHIRKNLKVDLKFVTRPYYTSASLVTLGPPKQLLDNDPAIWAFYSGVGKQLVAYLNKFVAICNKGVPLPHPATTLEEAIQNIEATCGLSIATAINSKDPVALYGLVHKLLGELEESLQHPPTIIYRGYDRNHQLAYFSVPLMLQQTVPPSKSKTQPTQPTLRSPISLKYFEYPLKAPFPLLSGKALLALKSATSPCKAIYFLPVFIILFMLVIVWLLQHK